MKKEILIPLGIVLISIASIYSLVNTNLTTKQEYEQHITLARQASKNGTIKKAVKEYKEAMDIKPSLDIQLEICDAYKANDDLRAAERWYEREVISAYPLEPKAYEYGLQLYIEKKKFGDAFSLYESFQKRNLKSEAVDKIMAEIKYVYKLIGNFEDVKAFSDKQKLAPVKQGEIWSYVDQSGYASGISNMYTEAEEFFSDIAAVVKNDKPMYINSKGDVILTPEYLYDANSDLKKITQFKEQIGNVILAYDGSKWAYYDATSYKKISENYKDATIITNGVGGATKNGGYWALLDSKANPITDEKFDSIVVDERGVPCRNDSLIVQKDLRYILVNKKGEQISDQVYEDAKGFNDTTLAAVKKGKKWIFIDPTGKEVDLGDFEEVSSFNGGLAAVKKNGKWGYIDMTGKIVIPCTFEDARLISESGIGFVKNDNGRWQLLQLIRLNHD